MGFLVCGLAVNRLAKTVIHPFTLPASSRFLFCLLISVPMCFLNYLILLARLSVGFVACYAFVVVDLPACGLVQAATGLWYRV